MGTIRSAPNSWLTSYATKGKASGFPVAANQQAYVYNVRAYNNSGSAINVGILQKLAKPKWKVWQYVDSGASYTDVTAAVQAGTATNIFDTTNNDGFAVQSSQPFGMIGMTISSTGSGGTYEYKYSNAATTYASLTTLEVPVYTSATDVWIVFQPPADWAFAGASSLNQSMYTVRVRGTTAPASAVAITNMWVGQFLEFYEGVANNGAIQLSFPDTKPYLVGGGESLIPYFSTTNAANQFGAFYSTF